MKKIFWIILIIIIIAFSGFILFSRTFFNNEPSPGTENKNAENELIGWQDYVNSEYGFSIKHPGEWESQEALKPQEIRALHEILFYESEYEVHRASLTIRIFDNSENKSINGWWTAWLSDEDIKKGACIVEYGEGNALCLFLRDLVEGDEQITFLGLSAHKVRLFRFNSEEECIYVAKGKYIYGICNDNENPNDPDFDENKDIYLNMRDSFAFEQVALQEAYSELLVGSWQSMDDTKSVKFFKEDTVVEELYDGKVMSTGSWKIVSHIGRSDGQEIEGNFLQTNIDGEEYLYTIVNLDDKKLTLTYLARGNTLEFVRIVDR